MQDEGKLHIKDLEQMKVDKVKAKLLKRKHYELKGYGSGEDMPESSDDDKDVGELKKMVRLQQRGKTHYQQQSAAQKTEAPSKKRDKKLAAKVAPKKHSGEEYRSKKGKGDVLRAGKHEPYAYIRLDPEMLNPKKKTQAVQAFAGVVSHGKKTDKRTGKKKDGLLAGLTFKGADV